MNHHNDWIEIIEARRNPPAHIGAQLVRANKLGLRYHAPYSRQGNESAVSDSDDRGSETDDCRKVRSIKGWAATKRMEIRDSDVGEDKFTSGK